MNKDTAKKLLKIFGILYYVLGILAVAFGIIVILCANADLDKIIKEALTTVDFQNNSPSKIFGVYMIITAICTLVQGWALRRAGKNGKTTLALVLFALSVIGSIVTVITTHTLGSSIASFVIELLILYSIIVVRKED